MTDSCFLFSGLKLTRGLVNGVVDGGSKGICRTV